MNIRKEMKHGWMILLIILMSIVGTCSLVSAAAFEYWNLRRYDWFS